MGAHEPAEVSQEYDFYHWSAILRSVSGFEVYRKVYRDVIRPLKFDTCSIIFHSLFTKKTCGINMLANVDP